MQQVGVALLGRNECRAALVSYKEGKPLQVNSLKAKIAYGAISVCGKLGVLPNMVKEHHKSELNVNTVYDEHLLSLMTNRAYNMPEVVVDGDLFRRVNVLVPAFSIDTISAGFFGVFNVALFIAKLGYKVRLVMFDNFYYSESEFKKALSKSPSMENLFDHVEVEYIGSRTAPLKISPKDDVVATVWYSAYFADKITKHTGRKFLYLIQDFEAAFYPFNSLYCISKKSYNFDYHTLASSKSLLDFLKAKDILSQRDSAKEIYFNNACSSSIYSREEFYENKKGRARKFVFYCRPTVDRNMFEMSALALIGAYKRGAFQEHDWEFYGMGIGNATVRLSDNLEVKQLPRMPLKEYEEVTKTFDLCLTLMASAHPSLIPADLAASGAVVVTNTFETKTPEYLTGISKNIIPSYPDVESLVDAICEAVKRTNDVSSRYENSEINWPRSWDETWTENHRKFIHEVFSE